jgi:hypothetical protein
MMTDIHTPKGMLTKQTWATVKQLDEMLKQHYEPDLPEPIGMVVTATKRKEAIDETVGMFTDKGWYAIAVEVEDKMLVRIWDKEFDYEGWLCQISGGWHGGDEERFMVIVKPHILDPSFEKLVSACAECKEKLDEVSDGKDSNALMVPGPGMEA